jgi:hypothetical protein
MKKILEKVFSCLIGSTAQSKPLTDFNVLKQFQPSETSPQSTLRNINAAFLIVLVGESHSAYQAAQQYLSGLESEKRWQEFARFYRTGLRLISSEIKSAIETNHQFKEGLINLYNWLNASAAQPSRRETIERVWQVFFPEGVGICQNQPEMVSKCRERRHIKLSKLNPSPIQQPVKEVLFTSNVLLTTPLSSQSLNKLVLKNEIKEKLKKVLREEQIYWYDHPIPIGIATEHNEIIYGLKGLDEALDYEVRLGQIQPNDHLNLVLSVSTTHPSLPDVVQDYLKETMEQVPKLKHLQVYAFTENDTRRLVSEVLKPAAKKFLNGTNSEVLFEVFGVDGEYGRHYSFLRAISPLWQIFIDPKVKGTFKIDLDQVFPQEKLVQESGLSAFSHLKTPLWGAEGIDHEGKKVELGLIAGSLVNQTDIEKSIFTPDVCFPSFKFKGDEVIFFSRLTQALSTQAEMIVRYDEPPLDGKKYCLQRIHVTGGTCGILNQSLRKYRPFTPTFIGRAEDQAYLLSVLYKETEKNLRYLHQPGLVMRHDKQSFALEAIQTAHFGAVVGDFLRVLNFSFYARALPWSVEKIKSLIDPFTGCFISRTPTTIAYLRLAFKAASLFNSGSSAEEAEKLIKLGVKKIGNFIQKQSQSPNWIKERYEVERAGWDIYYDTLERLEEELQKGNSLANQLREKTQAIVESCRIA